MSSAQSPVKRHLDQSVGVSVHRRGEEGFLAGEVRVDGGRRHADVAGYVGERDAAQAVGREPMDGRLEQGLAGPLALAGDGGVEGVRSHINEGLTISVNS